MMPLASGSINGTRMRVAEVWASTGVALDVRDRQMTAAIEARLRCVPRISARQLPQGSSRRTESRA